MNDLYCYWKLVSVIYQLIKWFQFNELSAYAVNKIIKIISNHTQNSPIRISVEFINWFGNLQMKSMLNEEIIELQSAWYLIHITVKLLIHSVVAENLTQLNDQIVNGEPSIKWLPHDTLYIFINKIIVFKVKCGNTKKCQLIGCFLHTFDCSFFYLF